MIDFKKQQFLNSVQHIIKNNPSWADDAITAINKGVNDAVDKWQNDLGNMAALLLLFYLNEKSEYEVSKEDKLRTVEFLSRYFNMDKRK